jgi:anion transporter
MSTAAVSQPVAAPNRFDVIRHRVWVPLAVVLTAAIWFMARPQGLSPEGQRALALFAGIFVLYLTEAIPLAVSSLLVVPAAVFMHIANVGTALNGFASPSAYLILGAFILATGMVKTKLAERITYMILSRTGSSPARITLGVTLANIVLAFLVPSTTARTAILLPMCVSIITLFGAEERSKFATGLLLILAFTNSTISAGILTATVPNPVTIEFLAKAGKVVTYADFLLYGFPPALLMTFFTWWFVQRVYRPEKNTAPGGLDRVIKERLAAMGKTTSAEWRALAIFLFITFLWATANITKLDTTVVCLLGDVLLFVPKFGVISWSDANKGVSWQVLLIAGGGISLGEMLMKTGAAKWLATSILRALGLQGASALVVLVVVMLIVQYMHLFFSTTVAMATALLPIVMSMGEAAHMNPLVLALPAGMIIGGYPLLMFYNTLPNIVIYGTGKLRVEDFPRVGVVLCTIACIVYTVCAATYWRWLGLF